MSHLIQAAQAAGSAASPQDTQRIQAQMQAHLLQVVDRVARQLPINRERLQELTAEIQNWIDHNRGNLAGVTGAFRHWVSPEHAAAHAVSNSTPPPQARNTPHTRSPQTIRNLQTAPPQIFLRQVEPGEYNQRPTNRTTRYSSAPHAIVVEVRPGMPIEEQQKTVLFKEWLAHLVKTGNSSLLGFVLRLLPDMTVTNMLPYLTANNHLKQPVEITLEKWQAMPEETLEYKAYQAFLELLQDREREKIQELMRKKLAEELPETAPLQRPQIEKEPIPNTDTNQESDISLPEDIRLFHKAQGLVMRNEWQAACETYLKVLALNPTFIRAQLAIKTISEVLREEIQRLSSRNPDYLKTQQTIQLISELLRKEIDGLAKELVDHISAEEMRRPVRCPGCHKHMEYTSIVQHLTHAAPNNQSCPFCRAKITLESCERDNPFRDRVRLKKQLGAIYARILEPPPSQENVAETQG